VALRIWGFQVGWSHGLRVASALGTPLLQRGPTRLAQAVALAAGLALPLAFVRVIGPGKVLLGGTLAAVAMGAVVVARLEGRLEGWRLALLLLGTFALFSVAR
jgi:PTS system mannose-specific IID component